MGSEFAGGALISETTADGWPVMASCELLISTVVEPAPAAKARSASCGIIDPDERPAPVGGG